MSSAREDLLHRVIDSLAADGVADRSLRQIAAGAGTSHRMLIYHFGSKERLLVAVVTAMEVRQRAVLADLPGGTPGEVARAFWRHLSAPEMAPFVRLFFECYGLALAGHPEAQPLLDGFLMPWLGDPLPDLGPVRNRMALMFTRGALLDLVVTGQRAAVDAMVEEFISLVVDREPRTRGASR